jgi:hypothetical protein
MANFTQTLYLFTPLRPVWRNNERRCYRAADDVRQCRHVRREQEFSTAFSADWPWEETGCEEQQMQGISGMRRLALVLTGLLLAGAFLAGSELLADATPPSHRCAQTCSEGMLCSSTPGAKSVWN